MGGCSSVPMGMGPPHPLPSDHHEEHSGWRAPDPHSLRAHPHCAPLAELLRFMPRTIGEGFGGAGVLSARQACVLEQALAQGYRGRQWQRLYLLSQHGASLSTLLRRSRGVAPTLLCVRTEAGHVLGAFSPSPWWDAQAPLGAHKDLPPLAGPSTAFFGYGGGAFVFSFAPPAAGQPRGPDCTPGFVKSAWNPQRAMQLQYLRVEPSKGGGVATAIGIGGGGESFALLLDEGLERGRSGQCAAFGSAALTAEAGAGAGDEEQFRALQVELWGFALEGSGGCSVAEEDGAPASQFACL